MSSTTFAWPCRCRHQGISIKRSDVPNPFIMVLFSGKPFQFGHKNPGDWAVGEMGLDMGAGTLAEFAPARPIFIGAAQELAQVGYRGFGPAMSAIGRRLTPAGFRHIHQFVIEQ